MILGENWWVAISWGLLIVCPVVMAFICRSLWVLDKIRPDDDLKKQGVLIKLDAGVLGLSGMLFVDSIAHLGFGLDGSQFTVPGAVCGLVLFLAGLKTGFWRLEKSHVGR